VSRTIHESRQAARARENAELRAALIELSGFVAEGMVAGIADADAKAVPVRAAAAIAGDVTKAAMSKIFATEVCAGSMALDAVPQLWRGEVQVLVEAAGAVSSAHSIPVEGRSAANVPKKKK